MMELLLYFAAMGLLALQMVDLIQVKKLYGLTPQTFILLHLSEQVLTLSASQIQQQDHALFI